MDGKKIVGLVGLGQRAYDFAPILLSKDITVVATDVNESARNAFNDEFDAVVVPSLSELLEYPLDCGIVTTPNRYHLKPTSQLLNDGCPVLLEKPLAHSMESSKSISDACEDADEDCYVTYFHRCAEPARVLRSKIRNGELGEIYHIEARYTKSRGIPALGGWRTSRKVSGGGALIDIGSHALDLAQFLLGFPDVDRISGEIRQKFNPEDYNIEEMYGEPGTRKRSDVEDSATALITFTDGKSITLESHWAVNQPTQCKFRLYGTEKGALIDFIERDVSLFEYDDRLDRNTIDFADESWRATDTMIDEFVYGASERRHSLATIPEALQTQRIIRDVYSTSPFYS